MSRCAWSSMEYRLGHNDGWWSYRAACLDCGWQCSDNVAALSKLGAIWVLRKEHRKRNGATHTKPCVVCDRPSEIGSPLCGSQVCVAAINEVRDEYPSALDGKR